MSRRSRLTLLLGGLTGTLLVYDGAKVALAVRNAATFPQHWESRAAEPVPPNALRVVALGDSIMQAIGARHPDEGIAGRVAAYLSQKTGRPVHVTNVSVGGATVRDVIEAQLPRVDLSRADLILVATANDMEKRVALDTYRADLLQFLPALPPDRTVISDLPLEPGRAAYQAALQQAADEAGIRRADFAAVFNGQGRRLDIFSWLLPHLNSTGYALWFTAFQPEVDALLGLD